MADAGLFLGWGPSVRGREAKGLEVFGEALEFYGRLEQDGRIESYEAVVLEPHGGELAGFFLIRGSVEQMSQLRVDEAFERLTTRATFIVEDIGVVGAYIGDGLTRAMSIYQEQIGALT
ncbi:MAG: hypothetical protein JWN32_3832 [Solirubrobacterales bacterium]|nr:hypothetical protein [Solirubrobacterales bacterium]